MDELTPEQTMLVLEHNGKEIGRIPATAPNRDAYILELVRSYSPLDIRPEPDENADLLSALFSHRKRYDQS